MSYKWGCGFSDAFCERNSCEKYGLYGAVCAQERRRLEGGCMKAGTKGDVVGAEIQEMDPEAIDRAIANISPRPPIPRANSGDAPRGRGSDAEALNAESQQALNATEINLRHEEFIRNRTIDPLAPLLMRAQEIIMKANTPTVYSVLRDSGAAAPGAWLASLTSEERKQCAMHRGLLAYFPDALALVARHSVRSNDKHNPGEPVNWARGKSTDQDDCIVRHSAAIAAYPDAKDDGQYEVVCRAWRALAAAQEWAEKHYAIHGRID